MKVIFMGTPDFSVPCLQALIDEGYEVIAVFTQPDKPKGRSKELVMTPVKELALKYNIPVYQPVKIKTQEYVDILRELNADVIAVTAFGQILSKEILTMPKYGCINVHASLLPKYRGAAPIQWAVIDGEKTAGVTTMQMDIGVDTGDMLLKTEIELDEKETGGSLFDKLSECGAKLLIETLKAAEAGTLQPVKQDESKATHAKMLDKSLGKLDFNNSAVVLERLIRGLNPWPSAYCKYNEKTLKIWAASVVDKEYTGNAGEIVEVNVDNFVVKCGVGALKLEEVQLEGKKRMNAADFLRGTKVAVGESVAYD